MQARVKGTQGTALPAAKLVAGAYDEKEESLPLCVCVCVYGSAARHVGSQFPDQGWNPHCLQWQGGVLPTGLPGKSQRRKSLTGPARHGAPEEDGTYRNEEVQREAVRGRCDRGRTTSGVLIAMGETAKCQQRQRSEFPCQSMWDAPAGNAK